MHKGKLWVIGFIVVFGLTASQAQAFTDVKGGSVTIQESAGGGDGQGNLNDLIGWLGNPDVARSGDNPNVITWRGEFQQKLSRRLLEDLGGRNEYPQLVAFLDDKIQKINYEIYEHPGFYFYDITWYYNGHIEFRGQLLTALEATSSASEVQKLRQWLSANEPDLGRYLDSSWDLNNTFQIFNSSCALACSQQDKYAYTFQYYTDKTGGWTLFSDNTFDAGTKTYTAQKCENLKTTFAPKGEWFSMLSGQCNTGMGKTFNFLFETPPTPFAACADKVSCLSGAAEFDMSDGSKARGVQQVPAGFVADTEKSLKSSNNTYVPCASGVCTPNTSGDYTLSASTPSSTYFGQCSGSGVVIAPPEAAIPSITSSINVHVANRAPVPTVTVSKNPIVANEEVDVTCDIVDPDECSDEIAKVKWSCKDSAGNSSNCSLWKSGTGEWNTGSASQDIIPSEQSNPYRATAKFKASVSGSYAVTCEATDNDANNPLSGTALVGIAVTGGGPTCVDGDNRCDQGCSPCDMDCDNCCGADNRCNQKCPYDPDCCVDPNCLPYCPGYGFDRCVVPAGSCVATRTKPSLDIDAVKPLDEVKFQAAVNGGGNPTGYTWQCDKNNSTSVNHASISRTDDQTCAYQNEGTYEPKASYQYKDEKGDIKSGICVNAQGVGIEVSKGVKNISSCSVATNSTDTKKGDTVTAKMNAQPSDVRLGSLSATWKADGKTTTQSADKAFKTQLNTAGANKIEAAVKNPDGTSVTCGPATVDVAEDIRWR